jgi:hypothetical protein
MTGQEALPFDIAQVLERFPGDAALIGRLVVENEIFRAACEDYVLAKSTLIDLEQLQQTMEPMEVADYRSLVAELEREIGEALRNAKQSH